MMNSRFSSRLAGALTLLVFTSACASSPVARSVKLGPVLEQSESSKDAGRLLIRTGELSIEVEHPEENLSVVETIISLADGFVERSSVDDTSAWISCRVPVDSLGTVMDEISRLGKVVRRSTEAHDVTDQHADLTARLDTSRQLRDRMRTILERASSVKDLLEVEKELARLQGEIESMESQLARLDSQIELSALSVRLEQKRIFGPLGYVGYWTGWAISKLFVIQ